MAAATAEVTSVRGKSRSAGRGNSGRRVHRAQAHRRRLSPRPRGGRRAGSWRPRRSPRTRRAGTDGARAANASWAGSSLRSAVQASAWSTASATGASRKLPCASSGPIRLLYAFLYVFRSEKV